MRIMQWCLPLRLQHAGRLALESAFAASNGVHRNALKIISNPEATSHRTRLSQINEQPFLVQYKDYLPAA